ncbi:MAG: ABC transporter ATP-binding protein [Solirubrobacterales bacterium]
MIRTPPDVATASSHAGLGDDGCEAGQATAISVAGVGHDFGVVTALADVTLSVAAGETVALVGPSGCGKSTLLELIGGLAEPTRGTIAVDGSPGEEERLARCAWMPQRDLLLPWRRAVDNAALALRFAGRKRADAQRESAAMLERLGLGGFAEAYPAQLSGGMRQRVAFARTLLSGKPVLLLDEPLAALDAITRADLQGWLVGTLGEVRRTTVLVTHDVEEAMFVADRVLLLSPRPGQVVWETRSPVDRSLPRAAAITAPEFVAARAAALEALAEASGS